MCAFNRPQHDADAQAPCPSRSGGGAARPCRHRPSTAHVVEALEEVAHALALGAEVGDVLGVRRDHRAAPAR